MTTTLHSPIYHRSAINPIVPVPMVSPDLRSLLASHISSRQALGQEEGRRQAQIALYGEASVRIPNSRTDAVDAADASASFASLPELHNRALGSILSSAAGDALGAPYECGTPMPDSAPVHFEGGRIWAKGEWTDDTAMSVPVLEAVAAGRNLVDDEVLGYIVRRWLAWSNVAKDMGVHTRMVFKRLTETVGDDVDDASLAQRCRAAARKTYDARPNRSGGNGSLMRTHPVALAFLYDGAEGSCAAAARAVAELTHVDPDTLDACVVWTLAIRSALLKKGEMRSQLESALEYTPSDRRKLWHDRLREADGLERPQDAPGKNAWVVATVQAAWSSIHGSSDIKSTLERAVRSGQDTDTVAAVAGALAGAKYGATALPPDWVVSLHGWPGIGATELKALVDEALAKGQDHAT